MYTQKQLTKIYNSVKIKYDPTNYHFRDRLIEQRRPETALLMGFVNFDSEIKMISKIKDFWKSKTDYVCLEKQDVDATTVANIPLQYPNILRDYNAYIVQTDNLNIAVDAFSKELSKVTSTHFGKKGIFEETVMLVYILTHPKSIAQDLLWTQSELAKHTLYPNLHTFEYLKKALEAKEMSEVILLDPRNVLLSNISSAVCDTPLTDLTGGVITNVGVVIDTAWDTTQQKSYKKLLKHMYENTIIFGLEIVYMLNTIYDTMTKVKLSSVLTRAENCNLENLIFKKDKVFIEPAIPLPDDAEKRFNTIRDYVNSKKVQDAVAEMVDRAYYGVFVNSVSLYFGTLISYAINLSIKNIRVKQCAILYNYCKANALFKPSETDIDDEYNEDEDDDEEPSTASPSSTFKHLVDDEVKESTNMLDLREDRRRSKKTAPGGGHESNPVFEALDGLIDNFRQDKYKFTVTDVVSTAEEDRAEYEAIASKVKLVNSVLTRQIREIKTYNVGGKNAGLSSGKLDRKSLHKYKTNKDIFYQNTYKIKECDPAFGIVLDASGSMCGRGIADGRVTMIVLHETLKALGVNHSIVDHTCYGGRYECDIRRYYSFKEDKTYKITKNYGIVRTTAESGNCDSGALYFMEKALLRTKNRDKICLIFSDGAPTECTGTDLVEQVRHMERCGIKVIGIGINFPNISKYYGTYANGKNLQDMLNIVSDILKEYVLTKKE